MRRARRFLLGVALALALAAWLGALRYPGLFYLAGALTLAAAYATGYRAGRRRARRRAALPQHRDPVADEFHRRYYDSGVFADTCWLGVPALKCPLDLWVYQEILHELRPEVIVETGTASGGSAYFLACVCDLLGCGEIISIDVEDHPDRPRHPRITYLRGSSTDPDVLARVAERARGRAPVLVLLDSDHRKPHVLAELSAYGQFVTPGSYLIVEDTNLGHPVRPEFGPGPMEAVEEFLSAHPEFTSDPRREKHLLTFNPRGYLRKSAR